MTNKIFEMLCFLVRKIELQELTIFPKKINWFLQTTVQSILDGKKEVSSTLKQKKKK
jgi:hypothetical protein